MLRPIWIRPSAIKTSPEFDCSAPWDYSNDPQHFKGAWDSSNMKMKDDKRYRDVEQNLKLVLMPGRRIWDLCANRVIPSWQMQAGSAYFAVSHAWLPKEERRKLKTRVNGYGWPVPWPQGVTIEQVRIELLNLGAQYAWLDVLCIRQDYPDSLDSQGKKDEEWKVDIPSIGYLYQGKAQVVHYYNGLGRPFHIDKPGNIGSDRHWLNRAWTLQEHHDLALVAGLTETHEKPLFSQDILSMYKSGSEQRQKMFAAKLGSSKDSNILTLLHSMRVRKATTEVDKVFGLLFPAKIQQRHDKPVIVYSPSLTAEDAWISFLANSGIHLWSIVFLIPFPGSTFTCVPTWTQVMSIHKELPAPSRFTKKITFDGTVVKLVKRALRIEGCTLISGSNSDAIVIEAPGGDDYPARKGHKRLLRDGEYTLLTMDVGKNVIRDKNNAPRHWLVAKQVEGDKARALESRYPKSGKAFYKKISVLQIRPGDLRKMEEAKLVESDMTFFII